MGRYELARQCERDSSNEEQISNGVLYPALKSLRQYGYIEVVGGINQHTGKELKLYKITDIGLMVLSWKIETFKEMIKLADDRLLPKA